MLVNQVHKFTIVSIQRRPDINWKVYYTKSDCAMMSTTVNNIELKTQILVKELSAVYRIMSDELEVFKDPAHIILRGRFFYTCLSRNNRNAICTIYWHSTKVLVEDHQTSIFEIRREYWLAEAKNWYVYTYDTLYYNLSRNLVSHLLISRVRFCVELWVKSKFSWNFYEIVPSRS